MGGEGDHRVSRYSDKDKGLATTPYLRWVPPVLIVIGFLPFCALCALVFLLVPQAVLRKYNLV